VCTPPETRALNDGPLAIDLSVTISFWAWQIAIRTLVANDPPPMIDLGHAPASIREGGFL